MTLSIITLIIKVDDCYVECRHAECRYAECRVLFIIIMLSVVAPFLLLHNTVKIEHSIFLSKTKLFNALLQEKLPKYMCTKPF